MKRYLYRVEIVDEPGEGADVHTGRLVYMSRSGATCRASYLRTRYGIKSVIQRSDLITWPEEESA